MDCDAIPKTTCEHSNHNILDREKDVKNLQTDVSTTLSLEIGKREEIAQLLHSAIDYNDECLKKIRSLTDEANRVLEKQIGFFYMEKELEEAMKQSKEEINKTDYQVHNQLTAISKVN